MPPIYANGKGVQSLDLQFPVEFKGTTIKTVSFRRPIGSDMDAMATIPESLQRTFLVKRLAEGLEPDFFTEIDGLDYVNCCEVIASFLSPGKTGRS